MFYLAFLDKIINYIVYKQRKPYFYNVNIIYIYINNCKVYLLKFSLKRKLYLHICQKKENILTKKELAEILNVSRPTLNKWEKEKPELVRLVNQGLLIDELIEEAERNLLSLKKLKSEINNEKFNIK